MAFLLGNTPHYLIALYATMRLGATAIPVNPIYTPDEISYILHNGDVKAVIALDMLLPLVEKGVQAFPQVKIFIVCETTPDIAEKVGALSPQAQEKHIYLHMSSPKQLNLYNLLKLQMMIMPLFYILQELQVVQRGHADTW